MQRWSNDSILVEWELYSLPLQNNVRTALPRYFMAGWLASVLPLSFLFRPTGAFNDFLSSSSLSAHKRFCNHYHMYYFMFPTRCWAWYQKITDKDNTEMKYNVTMWNGSRGSLVGCCEHSYEASGSMNRKSLDYVINYQMVMEDPVT
jgi:hypothetical protein